MNRLVSGNIFGTGHSTPKGNAPNTLARRTAQLLVISLAVMFAVDLALASVSRTLSHSRLKSKEQELLKYIERQTGQSTGHISPRYEFWTPKEIPSQEARIPSIR